MNSAQGTDCGGKDCGGCAACDSNHNEQLLAHELLADALAQIASRDNLPPIDPFAFKDALSARTPLPHETAESAAKLRATTRARVRRGRRY
jgi:uncharacterized protein YfaQ (DUF2300 family)